MESAPPAIASSQDASQNLAPPPSPAPRDPILKLHPDLQAPALAKQQGKLAVKIYLTANTAAAVEELKRLGFEVDRYDAAGGFAAGRLPAAKLAEFAALTVIRYIAPGA